MDKQTFYSEQSEEPRVFTSLLKQGSSLHAVQSQNDAFVQTST